LYFNITTLSLKAGIEALKDWNFVENSIKNKLKWCYNGIDKYMNKKDS